MDYYNSYDELYHYGVQGMKWGVRRKRTPEAKAAYKADKQVRRKLESDAYELGRWDQTYKRTYKRDSKRLDKMMAKDMKKGDGTLSNRTARAVMRNDSLKRDMNSIEKANREAVKRLDDHVDNMVKKYSDRSIKSVSNYERNGERYVNTLLTSMKNGNATYELRNYGDYYQPVKVRHY